MGTKIYAIIITLVMTFACLSLASAKAPSKKDGKTRASSTVMTSKNETKRTSTSRRGIATLPRSTGDYNQKSTGAAGRGPQQPLQVKGQARQLSMMLVLKNDKDSINFVKVRTDYQKEIINTEF